MRSFFSAISIFVAPLILICAGCASAPENQPSETMQISVDFREVHLCSRISPEITVAYAPAGTKFYDVRLKELGSKERDLGGGKWQNDETGIIPEGALTQYYIGPCPSSSTPIKYAYIVTAYETENSTPLAMQAYYVTPEYN